MSVTTAKIPKQVLDSVETLDELLDWMTARNTQVVAELREARREDMGGEFKPWQPRHLTCLTASK